MAEIEIGLEKHRGVVDGSVAASELLEELAGATENHALEFLGLAEGEKRPEATLRLFSGLQVRLHKIELGQSLFIVDSGAVEFGQNFDGILLAPFHEEPARGIRQHESANANSDGENDLQGDREPPLGRVAHVGHAEINPVGDESTDGDNGTLEADEETTVVSFGALGLPDRNVGRVHAITHPRNHTADDKLAETPVGVVRNGRNQSTDDHQNTTGEHQGSTADPLTEDEGENSTE